MNPTDKKDTPTIEPKSLGTKKQSTQKASVNGTHTYFPKTGEERNKWLPLTGGIVVISVLSWIILNPKRKKSPNKSFDD
ncbi:LPXTG cell wall anchor domain-containing protein [Enterococcus faecalis]|uniref:LPXTG cell wall anchor domain-containing protein n=1 Tax=Enterococcus faecalis TaxID=1351 RepID=UPI00209064F6|nr:LPXTG cell wall anchor domain-containing protein [Enterococcus faecalis]